MDDVSITDRARRAFRVARGKSALRDLWMALQRRPNELLAYDEVKAKLHPDGAVYRGLQTVPISQIVGSVNRYRDFDRAFLPRQNQTEDRWESIGRAHFDNISLPPVKLYKVGGIYFVVDGNHRVSVARELGQEYIDAEVQEVKIRVPISPDINPQDLEVIGDKIEFLKLTRLDETRPPPSRFDLTIPDGYSLLRRHIDAHRYLQSREWSREFSITEAAAQWCDQVYQPVVDAIRETGILGDFPGYTETDLYIWVIEHQYYLREQFGSAVSLRDAAQSFGKRFNRRFTHRLFGWLMRALRIDPNMDRLD
jgi:hypothetical protein